ncbi:DUF1365 domain-containing protein [Pseudomonas sp. LRF_L74]|uniref:DUF1365 domain-containing protein n=1 Tax=Pseudomonas sp. LRF_L74 TaxID=3369422 RepID=UPI003F6386C6
MNSALYSGWVAHKRFSPRAHAFHYRMGMLLLDLDEQDQVFGLSPLAGTGRFSAFSLRESDYLKTFTSQGMRLVDAVRQRVEEALGTAAPGPVYLLTQARSWGLAFNPASFFYCHDAEDRLVAILCEVTNTPWRERYHYVLPAGEADEVQITVAKSFHVSPFLPRDLQYRMRFSPTGERLKVLMEDWRGDERVFVASLDLQRHELSRASLHRHLLAFPWMTAKTVLAIYWQALRLLLKRTPIYDHQEADGHYRTASPIAKEHADEKPQPDLR